MIYYIFIKYSFNLFFASMLNGKDFLVSLFTWTKIDSLVDTNLPF